MANNKKIRYIINTVLGAALLAGAVAAGVFLLRGGKELPPVLESTPDAPSADYEKMGDYAEGSLGYDPNKAADVPSLHMAGHSGPDSIMEAEQGWYYVKRVFGDTGSGMQACFHDKATGEDVVLCARPECTHDTEYCVAQNSRYLGAPGVYYDGRLYGVSTDAAAAEEGSQDPDIWYTVGSGTPVLMRYAPDGTALDKLADLSEGVPDALDHTSLHSVEIIGHRGALWIRMQLLREYSVRVGENSAKTTYESGHVLLHYDIEKDKLTTILYDPLRENNYTTLPSQLQGAGDYVYFRKESGTTKDPLDGNHIYRIHIQTGIIEKVAENARRSYAVQGDRLVYLKKFSKNSDHLVAWLKDLRTGEEIPLQTKETDYAHGVCFAGEYIGIVQGSTFTLVDEKGNPLGEISAPAGDGVPDDCISFCVGETNLYASVQTANTSCYAAEWQTITSGDAPQWQLLWEKYEYSENISEE